MKRRELLRWPLQTSSSKSRHWHAKAGKFNLNFVIYAVNPIPPSHYLADIILQILSDNSTSMCCHKQKFQDYSTSCPVQAIVFDLNISFQLAVSTAIVLTDDVASHCC